MTSVRKPGPVREGDLEAIKIFSAENDKWKKRVQQEYDDLILTFGLEMKKKEKEEE